MTGLHNLEMGKLVQPGFEHRPSLYRLSYTGPITTFLARHFVLFYFIFQRYKNFFQYFPSKNMKENFEVSFNRIWYFFDPLFVADLWMLQLFSMRDKLFLSVNRIYWKSFLWSSYSMIAYKFHNHTNITPFSFIPSFDPLEMNTNDCAVHWAAAVRNSYSLLSSFFPPLILLP